MDHAHPMDQGCSKFPYTHVYRPTACAYNLKQGSYPCILRCRNTCLLVVNGNISHRHRIRIDTVRGAYHTMCRYIRAHSDSGTGRALARLFWWCHLFSSACSLGVRLACAEGSYPGAVHIWRRYDKDSAHSYWSLFHIDVLWKKMIYSWYNWFHVS